MSSPERATRFALKIPQGKQAAEQMRLTGDPDGPVGAEVLRVRLVAVLQEVILWVVVVIGLV